MNEKNKQQLKSVLKFLKFAGIGLLILLGVYLWYLSIPLIVVWYLYKKDKRFSPKTKLISSIVVAVIFLLSAGIIHYSNRTPVLAITEPQNGISIQSDKITVKGNVSPKKSKITISGIEVQTDNKGNFSYDAKLQSENNRINIEVDNSGKKQTQTIAINRIFTETELADIEKKKEEARLAQIEQVKQMIRKEIDSRNKPFDSTNYRGSIASMQVELALFGAYAKIVADNKNHSDAGVRALAKELESKVSQLQISEFPKLRKAYADMLAKQMWEDNMEIGIAGANNKTIVFTATIFANNKNIATTHSIVKEGLGLFRFTRANYKWYEYDSEYTYFKIDGHPDSEVVEIGK